MIVMQANKDLRERIDAVDREFNKPKRMLSTVVQRLEQHLSDHFEKLNKASKNQKFWAEVREGLSSSVDADSLKAEVVVSHPAILQKLYGGTIRMDDRRLAIPNTEEARRARTPRAMELRLGFRGRDLLVLEDAQERVQFWLKEEVTQQPFKETIPTQASMNEAVEAGLDEFVTIMRRGGGRP